MELNSEVTSTAFMEMLRETSSIASGWERRFRAMGWTVEGLKNGYDTKRFEYVSAICQHCLMDKVEDHMHMWWEHSGRSVNARPRNLELTVDNDEPPSMVDGDDDGSVRFSAIVMLRSVCGHLFFGMCELQCCCGLLFWNTWNV